MVASRSSGSEHRGSGIAYVQSTRSAPVLQAASARWESAWVARRYAPLTLQDVLAVVADPCSVEQLGHYFAQPDLDTGKVAYTGSWFERLDGGGDRDGVAGRILAADLLAVILLSVRVPTAVSLRLLEGDLGVQVAGHLQEIPVDVALGESGATELLVPGGHADLAWRLLEGCEGVGWVTAGKLLARKRPRLVPVWDNVVRCALGRPVGVWLWMDELFRADGGALSALLEEVRVAAQISEHVTPARVLDVILWMRHHASHTDNKCVRAGLPQLAAARR